MRLIANKKGLTQSTVVGAVVAAAVVFLILGITRPYIASAQTREIIEGCHRSVRLASWQLDLDNWVKDINIIDSPFKLDCKTIFTEITKDSINTADDKIKLGDTGETKEQLKEVIMRNMKECWYMFGEGKVKLQQAIEPEGTACVVCSEIIPNGDFKKKYPNYELKVNDLYSYAASTIPTGDKKSYLEYFLENTVEPDLNVILGKSGDKPIVLNKQYSVVFAISGMEERPYTWFGTGRKIEANTGIVDCYINEKGTTKQSKGDDAYAIGCNSKYNEPFPGLKEGENPGLIFGKVIDGGTNVELAQWRTFVPVPGFQSSVTLRTYPMTVRLVPTSQLANSCNRLY